MKRSISEPANLNSGVTQGNNPVHQQNYISTCLPTNYPIAVYTKSIFTSTTATNLSYQQDRFLMVIYEIAHV